MIVYRICTESFANQLDGRGSEIFGGRWNSPGIAVIYTSENSSLAMLEKLAKINLDLNPSNLKIVQIHLPDETEVDIIVESDLPNNWHLQSGIDTTRNIGNKWISSTSSLVLQVPSAVNGLESNFLINPLHPHFQKAKIIDISDLRIDTRIR